MPGSSPPPALRRPASGWHGRYLTNQVERGYAAMSEQLEALEQDIRHARRLARRAPGPDHGARQRPQPGPHGEPALLPDGTRVLVRPIEAADAPQLQAGFDRLDASSRYQRFLAPIPYLTQRELDYLTRVDHVTHEALVAIDAATGEGIGIARFVRDASDPARADVAVVVDDRWHGRGVGTLLADRLAGRARAVGVTSFTARMLAGNRAGRRLVEHVGDEIHEHEDGGAIVLATRMREAVQRRRALPSAT
jgi:GNAT superfamily N-acetyltransferase